VPVRWGNQARVPTSETLRAVFMYNINQYHVMGESTSIFRSNDGGATWQQQEHQPFGMGGDIVAFDALFQDLIAVGADPTGTGGRGWGGIDGVNWTAQDPLPVPGAPFIGSDLVTGTGFSEPNKGYFLRSDGTVRIRAGASVLESPSGHAAPRNIDAISAGTVAVVGNGGVIRVSTSFGDTGTWADVTENTAADLYGVQVLHVSGIIVACGTNGRVIFTDTGDNFAELLPTPTANTLRAVYFPLTLNHGWAVGDNGTIVKITGTQNPMTLVWSFVLSAQTSNTGDDLYDVSFGDNLIGVAVGENGTIRKTVDGGLTWTDPVTGGQGGLEAMNAVDFEPAGLRGIAVGANGTVLRTLNGGVTWTAFAAGIPGGQNLRGVSLSRSGGTEKALVCGDGGFVRRNTDPWGAGAWEAPGTAPPAVDYYGVVCWTDIAAIMVGNGSTVVQTNDLSDALAADWSWSAASVYTGNATNFRSLCVTSDLIAFAVGTGGRVVTSDLLSFPGNAWNEIMTDVTVPLTDPLVPGLDLLSVDAPATGSILYLACSGGNFRRVVTPLTAPTVQTGGVVPPKPAPAPVPAVVTNAVAVFGTGNLFLAGNGMWLSTDGGTTWTESFTHTKRTMNAVWRRSPTGEVGFACGAGGTVLRTDVGGD
jgi:photosystem II stability/assembly factor-like uncharacterized protein